ncbi:MAG: PRC-barrel domain-containing protein [Candidatus Promineifilaceae bacterium]|nr:PRC-barrel domain-containing protein [Candidatus Promineifilaceae bacterium]
MRLGKDLEGKPIISVADGRILARAKDVYVDPDLSKLVGLYTGSEGVIRRRSQVIPSDDVVLYGIDVILVKNADVIVNDKDLPAVKAWERLKDLQGREIVTPGGTKLGTVGDIILEGTGNIVGFSLGRIHVKGPLAEKGSVAREAVVNPNQEDGTIGVDLALLEELHTGVDTQSLEGEDAAAAKEVPSYEQEEVVDQEPEAEEIPIEVVESHDDAQEEGSGADPEQTENTASTANGSENE